MVRSEVLKLYRDILRTVRKIPDEYYREEMARWARRDFKTNKHLTDEVHVCKHKLHMLLNNLCKDCVMYN